MATPLYTLFETRFGACGIAWRDNAIIGIRFPEASSAATAQKLAATGARPLGRRQPPPFVKDAMQRVRRHLAGTPQDFSAVPLALEAMTEARRRIYQAARGIGPGETVTYEALAARAGLPGAARAAGAAMAGNPFLIAVPCHRVLAASGALHGFSAHGGIATKRRLLLLEGVRVSIPRSPLPRRRPDGLEFDWAKALEHLRGDPPLRRLIKHVGKQRMEIRALHDPFESLVRSIVYQQLSGKAAATILGRVLALFAPARGNGASEPTRFPSPDELLAAPEADLRAAGLSASKTKALRDLAHKALLGVVPPLRELRRLRDEEIIERLTSVWGVGKWSVEMMLMFRLGRSDVLPVDDLGVRKGFALTYGGKSPAPEAVLTAHAERWRPYRSVASWLMWRAVDLHVAEATRKQRP
jgi:methylated-DNA-[protein]-cysteine S-methyltransferase